jgi:predicted secreted protein
VSNVETSVGEEFELDLEGVPTSGFRWEVAGLPDDKVQLVGEDVEAASGPIGGSARERFRFRALAAGEAEIRFAHRRPWESKPPAEERTYRVTIHS